MKFNFFRPGLVAADSEIVDDKIANGKNKSRADGGHPYGGDLGSGGQRIHDSGDTGGNQDPKKTGSGQQSRGIAVGIPLFLQFRHHHFSNGADGGHS